MLENINLSNNYNKLQISVNNWLNNLLAQIDVVPRLKQAAEYSLFPGGKRIRPVLCCGVTEMLGLEPEKVRGMSLALELIHTSSLIHDDLPLLDNDDFRRGRPSCHKQFDEGTALLAGDMLIGLAFSAISSADEVGSEVKTAWCNYLSEAVIQLCSGQLADINSETKDANPWRDLSPTKAREERDRRKTGALFRASILSPLALLDADSAHTFKSALESYSADLGLLFQLADDLEDGVDFRRNEAKNSAEAICSRAVSTIRKSFSEKGNFLIAVTESILAKTEKKS